MQDLRTELWRWLVGDWARAVVILVAAVAVYAVALWITRTGKKRFFGRNTVFDVILALILGSVLSRAINGDAPLLPTAVAGFILVGMHFLVGVAATRSSRVGKYVKGRLEAVVQDGEIDWDAMRRHHLTKHDLEEAARQNGLPSVEDIRLATFERNGNLSIVPKPRLRILEIEVEEGVKTVRVEVYK